jgi:hypothetical protein
VAPEDVASTQDVLLETELIKTKRDPSSYFTDEFLPSS